MSPLISCSIVKKNRSLRRLLTGLGLAVCTFGWILFRNRERSLQCLIDLASLDPTYRNTQGSSFLLMVLSAIMLGLLGVSGWMGTLAYRAFQTGSYPPIQSMVRPEIGVISGWRATVKAGAALLLSVITGLTAIVVISELHGVWVISI